MASPTLEERTSRLEGSYDHLATKADVERLRVEFRADMERLRADVARWMFQLGVAMISAASVIAGIAVAVIKLT